MIIDYIKLIIMIILWSFSFVLVDIAIIFISPLSLALYRFIVASLTFIIVDIYQYFSDKNKTQKDLTNKNEKNFKKNDYYLLILASFTGCSFFFFAQYTAIELLGPTLPALFVCLLCPVIISILALFLFQEKLNKIKVLGFGIATIGGFLLVTGGDFSNLTPQSPYFIGYFFALLTPLLWAIYSTTTKKLSNVNSNIIIIKYISYFGTIELFIFVLISGNLLNFLANVFNIFTFISALYLGIGCYILGYYIWNSTQKKMDSSKVSSFLYVEPFITLLFSILFQRNDLIVLWNIFGGIIVLIGVLIINFK